MNIDSHPQSSPFAIWNLWLLQRFFSRSMADEEVWFDTRPEEMEASVSDLAAVGGDSGLLEAVRTGPPWDAARRGGISLSRATESQFVECALGLLQQRSATARRPRNYIDPGEIDVTYTGCNAPTYLPLLAVLVRAAAAKQDSYYAELRSSLQLQWQCDWHVMKKLEPLWRDLAQWTTEQRGQFGIFKYRRLGAQRWVGIPTSQSIFSKRDCTQISRIFAHAGVVPGDYISADSIERVRQLSESSPHLSSALKRAIQDESFQEPVSAQLRALATEWDGRFEQDSVNGDSARSPETGEGAPPAEIEVALSLSQGNSLPWSVRWRVPSLRNSGQATLIKEEHEWIAHFNGCETVTCVDNSSMEGSEPPTALAASILNRSATDNVGFRIRIGSNGEYTEQPLQLSQREVRYFTALADGQSEGAGAILIERELPACNGAYILIAPTRAKQVRQTLASARVESQEAPTEGLPHGWVLLYLRDCQQLGTVRYSLPDGWPEERARPRTVRLVGGLQLNRFGRRLYPQYDLPFLELDAPRGTSLEAAGLTLSEIIQAPILNPPAGLNLTQSVRRFQLATKGTLQCAFSIRALDHGQELGKVKLRIEDDSRLAIATASTFSLDSRGYAQPTETGLRGVTCPSGAEPSERHETLLVREIGSAVAVGECEDRIWSRAAARFLDALAGAGEFDFGKARDILNRLIYTQDEQRLTDAPRILRELQSRGYLEIESDRRGRWVRVHASPPTVYSLPVASANGHVVAGIAGTLRRQHWHSLFTTQTKGLTVHEVDLNPVLPALRLFAPNVDALRSLAQSAACAFVEQPAAGIACWASTLNAVIADASAKSIESLGTASSEYELFSSWTGRFNRVLNSPRIGDEFEHVLFRRNDPDTGVHKQFILGFRSEDGRSQFSYLPDARWGVWIALAAGAKAARDKHGIHDACPWPFPYDENDGTLWLPARIRLPLVLERALVLCSGAAPIEQKVKKVVSERDLLIGPVGTERVIGKLSRVYEGFLHHDEHYTWWLGYRWIPKDTAHRIAEALRGALSSLNN